MQLHAAVAGSVMQTSSGGLLKVPSGGCTLLRVCIIILVHWEQTGTVVTRLLAAHAIACCSRLALSCRLVPQLSFQQLGLAVSPGCCSEWWWLLRGLAMQQLQCTLQAEFSGDCLQVPQVRCMPHGACSTLPPWQEGEGPRMRSWCMGGNPSRLNSCWGLGAPLAVCCVQRWLLNRLQAQADRVVWCLANSGGLLMVPRGGCMLLGACTTISTRWY